MHRQRRCCSAVNTKVLWHFVALLITTTTVVGFLELCKFRLTVVRTEPAPTRHRVLLTDIMFPSTIGAWRINEIQAFIDHYDTDILVMHRTDSFAGIAFPLEWKPLLKSHHLHKYNALIFDPAYAELDELNKYKRAPKSAFNGSAFYGTWPASYMLRLRKYGSVAPSFEEYDAIHHIFLGLYHRMRDTFPGVQPQRQSIHLYPGGGFSVADPRGSHGVHKEVLLFPTQAFMLPYIAAHMPDNPVVAVFGAPLLAKNAKLEPKPYRGPELPLRVVFTSLGDIAEKGADLYVLIAERFKRAYPADNVVFYGIGNVPASPAVVRLPPMSQEQLTMFYRGKADVYFNLDRTDRRNGWPLGGEAVLQGLVLFTTDRLNLNRANGYNFTDGLTIVVEHDEGPTLAMLHEYVRDRRKLASHSAAMQSRAAIIFGFSSQTTPMFAAIDARIFANKH